MLLYHIPKTSIRYKNTLLLFASLLFYFWGDPAFMGWIIVSIFVDWFCCIQIETAELQRAKKIWMFIAIFLHLSLLFYFKYFSFAARQVALLFPTLRPTFDIALPIGISFFTFQMMSYVLDVYRGKIACQKNIGKLALYIMFFPQLIAGPIVRYEDVAQQIDNRSVSWDDFYAGATRFIVGLSKKILLADILAVAADTIFLAQPQASLPAFSAWIGAAAFSLQIYFDFSGYSDMAIGIARCFGFHFLENFDHPYIATSVIDFWKRWHISLTQWFRDYVYIPLGGNRVGKRRWIFNLACVWLLTGIWHGANWTFLLWGGIYFVLQLFEKLNTATLARRAERHPLLSKGVGWLYTMLIVCCCWVIFKAESIHDAFSFLADMFGRSGILYDDNTAFYARQCFRPFLAAAICCLPIGLWVHRGIVNGQVKPAVVRVLYTGKAVCLIGLLALCLLTAISGAYSPFIYFNF